MHCLHTNHAVKDVITKTDRMPNSCMFFASGNLPAYDLTRVKCDSAPALHCTCHGRKAALSTLHAQNDHAVVSMRNSSSVES